MRACQEPVADGLGSAGSVVDGGSGGEESAGAGAGSSQAVAE